nr:hypothetical protein [Sphingomonas quercus]
MVAVLALSACADKNELAIDAGGVGQRITRSICPAVAVPTYLGDVTLFNPPSSHAAAAIDVVGALTDIRADCNGDSEAPTLDSNVTFRVDARRENVQGARDVTFPYFATIVRGGTNIVSKQVGQVTLHFADGQARASATASAHASIQRSVATLPEAVRNQITRKRRPTDADASVDPLADPKVRNAVNSASFELLLGFQLDDAQLAYNATR